MFSIFTETIISFLILSVVIAYTIWYANQAEE
jgi:hypothetical protein